MRRRNDSLWKLWLMVLIISVTGCATTLSPYHFINSKKSFNNKMIIEMHNTMHLTPKVAVIDSAALLYKVMDGIMSKPTSKLKILVYFNGAGPNDYRLASVAAYVLKDTLMHHHYPGSRIEYDVKFFVPELNESAYPYRKVDFIVTSDYRD